MNAIVNIELARRLSRELYSVSKSISRITGDLEEVERVLRRQTEFNDCLRMLKKARTQTGEEQYRLSMLAGGLENIAQLYFGAEQAIQENFEPGFKLKPTDITAGEWTAQKRRILEKIYGR